MVGINLKDEIEKHIAGKNILKEPMPEREQISTEENKIDYSKLDAVLEKIIELRPIEKGLRIKQLSVEVNLEESFIKEELKSLEKRKREALKIEKEKLREEEKRRNEELKRLRDQKKEEEKAEEKRRKEEEKEHIRLREEADRQSLKSKMEKDFAFKILNLIATEQEDQASELIAKKIEEKYYIYSTRNDIKSEVWVYRNGIVVPNGKSLIEFLCRRWMGEAYNTKRANNVIAKIKADTQIEEDFFFNKQNENLDEIPVRNGILNIFTRKLSPFTHEKIFFNKLPVTYDPEAKCPAIEKFFNDVLAKEDDKKVMFELIGFSLLKEYRYEKAFMFVGDGRNGKGKTINLIKRFLGPQNYSSVPLDQFNTSSSGIHELFGKLINLAGDISPTALKDTGLLKQLCGRDNINAKRKYLRDLSFENYAKLIFAANELPRVYDFSMGFWSRWILLEFPYTFVGEKEFNKRGENLLIKRADPSIIDKISTDSELSGLLNQALDGLERLEKNKGFSYTKGTSDVKTMWVRKSDSFTAFCMDFLEETDNGYITKKTLRSTFHKFCRLHKLKGASDTSIKVTLESLFGVSEIRVDGSFGEWAWSGVKFKEKIR